MPENRLRQIDEEKVAPDTDAENAAMSMILLGLKTLSQRTIVALGDLFTTLTCISAFWLWYSVLPAPNAYQLVGVGLYGLFILLLHIIRRKP